MSIAILRMLIKTPAAPPSVLPVLLSSPRKTRFRQVVDCAHLGSDATSARPAMSLHRGASSLCRSMMGI
jgi:hypothetical protein